MKNSQKPSKKTADSTKRKPKEERNPLTLKQMKLDAKSWKQTAENSGRFENLAVDMSLAEIFLAIGFFATLTGLLWEKAQTSTMDTTNPLKSKKRLLTNGTALTSASPTRQRGDAWEKQSAKTAGSIMDTAQKSPKTRRN